MARHSLGQWLWPNRRQESASDCLGEGEWAADPNGDACLPSLRQPALRESRPSVSRNAQGQRPRPHGAREGAKGHRRQYREADRGAGSRDPRSLRSRRSSSDCGRRLRHLTGNGQPDRSTKVVGVAAQPHPAPERCRAATVARREGRRRTQASLDPRAPGKAKRGHLRAEQGQCLQPRAEVIGRASREDQRSSSQEVLVVLPTASGA